MRTRWFVFVFAFISPGSNLLAPGSRLCLHSSALVQIRRLSFSLASWFVCTGWFAFAFAAAAAVGTVVAAAAAALGAAAPEFPNSTRHRPGES